MKFFICSYTNVCKKYADEKFFSNLDKLSGGSPVFIVDNTSDEGEYTQRIQSLIPKAEVVHLDISKTPKESAFQRCVADSVNLCRDKFLESDCDVMLVLESDVIPPVDLVEKMTKSIELLDHQKVNAQIVGGLYYIGWHNYSLKGLQETHHVLSGCTAYKRELIASTPFRWAEDNLAAFSDALISYDCIQKGYSLWNDHDIKCLHLELSAGSRNSHPQ